MITIKVINKTQIIRRAIILLLITIVSIVIMRFFLFEHNSEKIRNNSMYFLRASIINSINDNVLIACIDNTLPIIKIMQPETDKYLKEDKDIRWFIKALTGMDLSNPETIINSQIVLFEEYNEERTSTAFANNNNDEALNMAIGSRNAEHPGRTSEYADKDVNLRINEEDAKQQNNSNDIGKNIDVAVLPKKIRVSNKTTLDINVEELLGENLSIDFSQEGPKILIVHAHTSEAYTPTEKYYYTPSDPDRTEDVTFNVARVGEEMASYFTEKGIGVVHDKTIHDYPSYSGSYQRALETTMAQLEEHPSIKIILDIHRDGFIYGDGSKLKTATTIKDEGTSKVMLVVGTNQRGLYHPNWRENLKLAAHLQQRLDMNCPGLTRPIDIREERFNQHVSTGSLLIEVGSNGDTLEEAISSCKYIAEALADIIKVSAEI